MNIHEIKLCIESYQDFISNTNSEEIIKIYENANVLLLDEILFVSGSNLCYYLYLGLDNNQLIGILVNEDTDYTEWTSTTQFYYSLFIDSNVKENCNYTETSLNLENPSPTSIDSNEALKRIHEWIVNKNQWITSTAKQNQIVQVFKIPIANFSTSNQNILNLGLISDINQIDLIVDNGVGFYDYSNPIPPFKMI